MNRWLTSGFICLFSCQLSCSKGDPVNPGAYECSFAFVDSSKSNPENQRYQELLDNMTASGVPGIILSVHSGEHGEWIGSSGKADIHNRVPMKACNITRAGSTVKTFTAVTILMLVEDGLISLDDQISKYLSGDVLDRIENAGSCTVRQLLHHSSGIYNYIQNLQFQTASINDLLKVWEPEELLDHARNKAAYFRPDADVRYSNTNYILLGMIIEKITGKPFYRIFEERIFQPLHLTFTRFAAEDPVPEEIVRGYIDLYSNLQLLESTHYSGWDYYTADGGLISNPHDLSVFLRALFSGSLISDTSLDAMLTWKVPVETDNEFYPLAYGLGIFRLDTPYGTAYYHSGDAIGYFAQMMYFESTETTIVWATNGNYGKIDHLVSSREAMEKIFKTVFTGTK
jgi:D-alanyl-D-alanine carboxypeptidase